MRNPEQRHKYANKSTDRVSISILTEHEPQAHLVELGLYIDTSYQACVCTTRVAIYRGGAVHGPGARVSHVIGVYIPTAPLKPIMDEQKRSYTIQGLDRSCQI
jgi:hypothetical protein